MRLVSDVCMVMVGGSWEPHGALAMMALLGALLNYITMGTGTRRIEVFFWVGATIISLWTTCKCKFE